MIPDPGNHSFNYIFCSLPFPPPSLSPFLPSLPSDPSLPGFSLWPDVCHVATTRMASSLPPAVWSNGNEIFQLRLFSHFFFICSLRLSFLLCFLDHILLCIITNSCISKKQASVQYVYVLYVRGVAANAAVGTGVQGRAYAFAMLRVRVWSVQPLGMKLISIIDILQSLITDQHTQMQCGGLQPWQKLQTVLMQSTSPRWVHDLLNTCWIYNQRQSKNYNWNFSFTFRYWPGADCGFWSTFIQHLCTKY